MKFLCSGCGACCKLASLIGLPSNPDGSCIFLNEDNTCEIYENRPKICSVEKMYDDYLLKDPSLTKKNWYKMNTKVCHKLIDKQGLDKKYKINIEDYNEGTDVTGNEK
tara:strand:- start:276 stop:599 length:324 start_codon:yes stop_codon:yes gene_type:complete